MNKGKQGDLRLEQGQHNTQSQLLLWENTAIYLKHTECWLVKTPFKHSFGMAAAAVAASGTLVLLHAVSPWPASEPGFQKV